MSVNTLPESQFASRDGNSPTTADSAAKLKNEIDRLFKLQRKALEAAVFLGMTPKQAQEVDARRKKIMILVNQLATLKSSTKS